MIQNANNLCWLDMEMTGLDPERERIIEVAMIITDSDLNVLAQSEVYVVHQSDELLDGMELAKRWNPPVAKGVVKRGSHQALDDILESIEEMRYYRETFLKLPEAV